ncbi:MAG: hypothetical protein WA131_01900 [Desulfitobacteriaceae bacterium]
MKNFKTYCLVIILLFVTNIYTFYLYYDQAENIVQLQTENLKLKNEYTSKTLENELDFIAKGFIKAIKDKDDNIIKSYVAKNIEVNKELQIKLPNNVVIHYPYPSEINTLKLSFFDQKEFRIGYEFYNNNQNIRFINISFIREQDQWKIQNIENDT